VLRAVHEAERLAHERLDQARRRGGPHAAAGALEQPHAEECLEAAQMLRDRGLAEPARLRRARHAARVQDGHEQLEAMQREAGFGQGYGIGFSRCHV
jgi:hypothetical protein